MTNEQRMALAGPWASPEIVEATRPRITHARPGSDEMTDAALKLDTRTLMPITPDDQGEYGFNHLMAALAANIGMLAKQQRYESFSISIPAGPVRLTAGPKGVIRFIANNSNVQGFLNLGETQTGDALFYGPVPAGGVNVFIPWVQQLWVRANPPGNAQVYPMALNGNYE